jgi:signal transduction histidine kinase
MDLTVRVLINLLDNAVRHTPSDGDVLVAAERTPDGQQILLRVADSGRGIPAEEREKVFEKFKQAKGSVATRGQRGTGLGLTFCRLAVEAHGGHIWVEESSPLGGASFAFTMPIAAPEVVRGQLSAVR